MSHRDWIALTLFAAAGVVLFAAALPWLLTGRTPRRHRRRH